MKKLNLTLSILLLFFYTSCSSGGTENKTIKVSSPSTNQIYFAAFPDFGGTEDNVSTDAIENFESVAQKNIAWACFSNNWYKGIKYPKSMIHTIDSTGIIPYVRLMPRSDEIQDKAEKVFTLQNIIDGKFDTELKQWAIDAKNDAIPILADFALEMNGDWFPWSGIFNGAGKLDGYGDKSYPDGPERYRDAYRHIIDIFDGQGAKHITWMFHVNLASSPDKRWNTPAYYYPGDDYIDWIGFSLYGVQTTNEEWEGLGFSDQLKEYHKNFLDISHSKPIALLEFGVTDNHPDGNKSAWLNDAFQNIIDNPYMKFQAINPWHENWQNEDESWSQIRLDSSPEVQSTFRRWISNPRFISKVKFSIE